MKPTVFIDGEAGTTGLQIRQRLEGRADLQLVSIDPDKRKDSKARADMLNGADAVVLCLPDDAAKEAVSLIVSPKTKVIDASTAHRVAPDWAYGFAELERGLQRERIASATRISNPGCYPTGFIGLVAPLVKTGLIPPDFPLTVNAVSGYSGGGKGLIAEFEGDTPATDVFRPYAMNMMHKHLPEMKVYTGLAHPPVFAPSVCRYEQGMIVEVPLQLWALPGKPTADALRATLEEAYPGERFVSVADAAATEDLRKRRAGAAGYVAELDPETLNNTNSLRLYVFSNPEQTQARLVAVLDNLGKGASGAAVQNLNLALGLDEGAGL